MSNEPLSSAELETLYTELCNGVETLHQQSEAQRGLARVLFFALSSFLPERGARIWPWPRTARNRIRDTANERVLTGMPRWGEGSADRDFGVGRRGGRRVR
jgi:hypothetical protein